MDSRLASCWKSQHSTECTKNTFSLVFSSWTPISVTGLTMDVDASRVAHLINCLRDRGVRKSTISGILKQCDIPEHSIWPSPQNISYLAEALFVRAACDEVGDITFGAVSALSYNRNKSITGYIGKHSKNLGRAIKNASRFTELVDPAVSISLRDTGNAASFEVRWKDASYSKYHRHMEFMMFSAVSRMRHLTQTNFFPIEIRFDHLVRNSAKKFAKIAGFPVVFEAEKPEILLSRSSLELAIPTYDPSLRDHLTAFGERLLSEARKPEQNLRGKIEGQITAALPGRMPSADEVAASLGMSPRTLARRLRDFGLSYRVIVDELRFDLAKTLLKDGLSMIEVAFALGYADQAAFSTAFKRWSGKRPSEMQPSQRP